MSRELKSAMRSYWGSAILRSNDAKKKTQGFMAAMSIVESKFYSTRAQGAKVDRVSIRIHPMSFAASYFKMEVKVFPAGFLSTEDIPTKILRAGALGLAG